MKVKRALFSVSDKKGILEFAYELCNLGIEIISTGGTAKILREKIPVTSVSEVTNFPEILDGRVKTLHPKIHGGILNVRNNSEHQKEVEKHNIKNIDLVVVNLYPFMETISKNDATIDDAVENIDIGGPCLLRSAAKNYGDVAVVVDPEDYEKIINELKNNDEISLKLRKNLAVKAYRHTASYDIAIYNYLSGELMKNNENNNNNKIKFPGSLFCEYRKIQELRYGENPQQQGAFYRKGDKIFKKLHGKELSFNNIVDTNDACELINEFNDPCVTIVKHSNPCGIACAGNIDDAYDKAYSGDPMAAFGGVIALNRTLTAKAAEKINKIFIEIVTAPDFEDEALEILKQKKNIRILKYDLNKFSKSMNEFDMKKVAGGMLLQDKNNIVIDPDKLKIVSEAKPTPGQIEELIFANTVVKHVKSNAIVLSKNKKVFGIGAGQMSRVDASKIACGKAGDEVLGCVMASDAFFPFRDGIDVAAKKGIAAVIQPGGSIHDRDAIDAVNEYKIPMVFTGVRHFKH